MKRAFFTLNLFLLFSLLFVSSALAVPSLISYQGTLYDSGGSPVNATVSMTFKIYDVETGSTALWSETQSVQVSSGIFNVQLGSVQPLTSSVFQTDTRYVGVQVGADPEMTPRQRMTSGSYSHQAALVQQVIVPVGTIMAWNKSMTGTPGLPGEWVECNGQTLADADSPYDGQTIPDLNGVTNVDNKKVLEGNNVSGVTNSENYLPSHSHSYINSVYIGYAGNAGSSSTGGASGGTSKKFYTVVWIMRVK